ncbi:MAG: TIGR03905 family TSCPD domain-containing protein [Acetobacterium sp.]|nr:TIGR03905 family TSCPD domain-containing protein [Acetobacterium sp.]
MTEKITLNFKPQGVCIRNIEFDLEDDVVSNLAFEGGCDGNLKALEKLLDKKSAAEIITMFKGQTCGKKPTSCMDQLVIALEQARKEKE